MKALTVLVGLLGALVAMGITVALLALLLNEITLKGAGLVLALVAWVYLWMKIVPRVRGDNPPKGGSA